MLKRIIGVVFLVAPFLSLSQYSSNLYSFEGLTNNDISGQDNWQYFGDLSLPSSCVVTPSIGAYNGGLALQNNSSGGITHCFVSRKNDLAWGYNIASSADYLVVEFDYDNGNWWGEWFQLGFDKNMDGDFNIDNITSDNDEVGIGLSISTNILSLYRADGSAVITSSMPWAGSGWTRYRITIELDANGGQGSGSVCFKNLTNNGEWTSISTLQNINMLIDPGSNNQTNLQNLNGIVIQQEAGGAGIIDNIRITTIDNTLLMPISVCTGSDFTLNTLSIPSATNYTWGTPDGSFVTTSSPSLTLENLTEGQEGIYTVQTDDCSPFFWSVYVTVVASPQASIVTTSPLCIGDPNGSIAITVNDGTAPYDVSWSGVVNGNPAGNEILTSGESYNISSLEAGIYTITVTDGNGCVNTITANVIEPSAIVESHVITPVNCYGEGNGSVAITVNGGTPPYNVSWSGVESGDPLGSEITVSGDSWTIIDLEEGMYEIAITDLNNCIVTAPILLNGCNSIIVPNVIVLGSNAGNDKFFIQHDEIEQFICIIMDRWGNKIYEFNDPKGFWDGTDSKGERVIDGVYFYLIQATLTNGDELEKQGFLQVFH